MQPLPAVIQPLPMQHRIDVARQDLGNAIALFPRRANAVASSRKNSSVQLRVPITWRRHPLNSQTQVIQAGLAQRFLSRVLLAGSWMMPRLPVDTARCAVAMISPVGVTRFCSGMGELDHGAIVIPGLVRSTRPGISRFRVRCFTSPRNDNYAAPSRIGGWNDSAVSQGKKIQVSCDTSVMKVSTSGRPCGLA